jgi:hypothetical protein
MQKVMTPVSRVPQASGLPSPDSRRLQQLRRLLSVRWRESLGAPLRWHTLSYRNDLRIVEVSDKHWNAQRTITEAGLEKQLSTLYHVDNQKD